MPKYTFSRRSIVDETFIVEAGSEDEALELVQDEQCDLGPTEWVDWYDDSYELMDVEDELMTFLNSKEQVHFG